MAKLPKYVSFDPDRFGNDRWYYRRKGRRAIRQWIKDDENRRWGRPMGRPTANEKRSDIVALAPGFAVAPYVDANMCANSGACEWL